MRVARLLALGDSYTIGEGVAEHDRWPNQLARLLRAHDISIDEPHIVARTAWTTDELFDAIAGQKILGPYDFVTLLSGVNDQYRDRSVASFAADFAPLLRKAINFAGRNASRVIAISIPDWGATPFAESRDRVLISREIDAYNDVSRNLAKTAGTHWIDVTDISRQMSTTGSLVAPDGLHPSGEMYARWAELILPIAIEILSRSRKAGSGGYPISRR